MLAYLTKTLSQRTNLDVDNFGDFPAFDQEPDEDTDTHHKVGLVVEHVQNDNNRLEYAEEHRAHR